jgi:hypothetical protein
MNVYRESQQSLPPQNQAEILSWNQNILSFDLEGSKPGAAEIELCLDRTLAGFFDPLDPDPCGQFSCSGYWPLQ